MAGQQTKRKAALVVTKTEDRDLVPERRARDISFAARKRQADARPDKTQDEKSEPALHITSAPRRLPSLPP